VHTALAHWERTDYDARTPGAGMFRTQYDAYARVLLNESKAHGGPAISEGNFHWFYAGIADGNYATILPFGSGHTTPPLVDFDLLKMHTKMTDLGVGSPFTYFGYEGEWRTGASRLSQSFDRFITATIAYGHIGYLAEPWGFDGTLKCYYMLQALQKRYVLVPVKSIRYFDGSNLLDTSRAIASDAHLRGQIRTEYENGLTVWCNLSETDSWSVEVDKQTYLLPPNAFVANKPGDLLAYSAVVNGARHELVSCRDYLYLDSRDQPITTRDIAATGTVAIRPASPDAWRVIPATKATNVSIALAWLGVDSRAAFAASACDIEEASISALTTTINGEYVAIAMEPGTNIIKYRLNRAR
jgi:hypothetical protein